MSVLADAVTMDTTTLARPGLATLVADIRQVIDRGMDAGKPAQAVADLLRGRDDLDVGILTPDELHGEPGGYAVHLLHAEKEFSVAGLVWQPGAETPVHDHIAWCTFAVLSGVEHETLYRVEGERLVEIGRSDNRPGDVSGFAPPGDIHKVKNTSSQIGVSIHVYGADLAVAGSSIRRVYDLPVA